MALTATMVPSNEVPRSDLRVMITHFLLLISWRLFVKIFARVPFELFEGVVHTKLCRRNRTRKSTKESSVNLINNKIIEGDALTYETSNSPQTTTYKRGTQLTKLNNTHTYQKNKQNNKHNQTND